MAKGACIGVMENGIAAEIRCVFGSMLSHFLPIAYWLGCITIHFIHLLHYFSPALRPLVGGIAMSYVLNKGIKEEEVALLVVGIVV